LPTDAGCRAHRRWMSCPQTLDVLPTDAGCLAHRRWMSCPQTLDVVPSSWILIGSSSQYMSELKLWNSCLDNLPRCSVIYFVLISSALSCTLSTYSLSAMNPHCTTEQISRLNYACVDFYL
jgi:hypothetical protein